jgi:hypothetical protein
MPVTIKSSWSEVIRVVDPSSVSGQKCRLFVLWYTKVTNIFVLDLATM